MTADIASPLTRPLASPPASDLDYARAYDTLDFLVGMVEAEALIAARPPLAPGSLPLVIVTGFLGAGKTTLMRHLLSSPGGRRITAIVNDVADLNIDAALVQGVSEDTISLANGCVCCSQSGGAARALIDVRARDAASGASDLILLEASGVADPWALAQVAASVPGIQLDAVIAIVDAESAARLDDEPLLARQVAAADLVLLNKIDLVDGGDLATLEASLAAMAPRAQILRTEQAGVPSAIALDAGGRRGEATKGGSEVLDDGRFTTWSLTPPASVDRDRLEAALASLPDGVLRLKGFLRLSDRPEATVLLQVVGRRWRFEAAPAGAEPGLVAIAVTAQVTGDALAGHLAATGITVGD